MNNSLSNITPSEWRKKIRTWRETVFEDLDLVDGTAGICNGYVQANLAIVPSEYAADLKSICERNFGPCPLLFSGEKGQVNTEWAEEADVRQDLLKYFKWEYKDGQTINDEVSSLKDIDVENFQAFYFGCSFSFDSLLLENGIVLKHVKDGRVISMFDTSIDLIPAGSIKGKLVVSMRVIPVDTLQQVIDESFKLPTCHGVPIQIGEPHRIGIADVSRPDYGNAFDVDDKYEVSVFWCCGVTSQMALSKAQIPVMYSHVPGYMSILDQRIEDIIYQNEALKPICVELRSLPRYFGSLLSKTALEQIEKIEKIMADDIGGRGIGNVVQYGSLVKAALALSHSSRVAIFTGYPMKDGNYENDGITGAFVIAKTCMAFGKAADIFLDDEKVEEMMAICNELKLDICLKSIRDFDLDDYDQIIAIERPGAAADGTFRYMSGDRNPNKLDLELFNESFLKAAQSPVHFTTCICDGGNELGCGSLKDLVVKHVPKGDRIAAEVPANFVLVSGVSNWGGFGLAQALKVLQQCAIHQYHIKKGIDVKYTDFDIPPLEGIHTAEAEETWLKCLEKYNIVSGIPMEKGTTGVDGLLMEVQADVIAKITSFNVQNLEN